MQQINCSFCGLRDQSEFTYVREMAPVPVLDARTPDWQRYVYDRDNPCGPHMEWWHHNHGCRQLLAIERDTRTHEVLNVSPARTSASKAAA